MFWGSLKAVWGIHKVSIKSPEDHMGLHVRIHDNIRRGQLCCKDSMIVNHTFTNVTELQSYLFILPVALYFCGDLSIVFFVCHSLNFRIWNSHFQLVMADCHKGIAGSSRGLQTFMSPLVLLVMVMTTSRIIPSWGRGRQATSYEGSFPMEHPWS